MSINRRAFLQHGIAMLSLLPGTALGQTYPNRPIRLVVPFSAGGTTDLAARIMGKWLAEKLGQAVVIENRPGGGTVIATQAVTNAAPDGYTLLLTVTTNFLNPSLYKTLPFDFKRDIVQVSGLAELPLVLVVNTTKMPVKTFAEFVSYAKANPGKVDVGSFGAKTISHLSIELFKSLAGIDVVHIPYGGDAPLMGDLIPGRVPAGVVGLTNALPQLRDGTFRALAVMSSARATTWPDAPTMEEVLPGSNFASWCGVGAPRGTSPEIVERLSREINAGLADPGVRATFAEMALIPLIMTPAQTTSRVNREIDEWGKVIQSAGIKPE